MRMGVMCMKKAMVVLLVLCMACSGSPALALDDNLLRTAFWVSSGVSASWVSHQQAMGMYELNPVLGRHPDNAAVMALNLVYGVGTEYIYRDHPKAARLLWALGTVVALGWIAHDIERGIDGPGGSFMVTFPIARW